MHRAFLSLGISKRLLSRLLMPWCLLWLLVSGCECGDIVTRSCINDQDCAKSAPDIYCFEKKCSPFQCSPGEQELCYEGAIETRDKGICKAGRRSCLGSGLWSTCVGQILARPELCDRLDNDCNGKADDGLDCRCSPGSKQQCYGGPSETFGRGTCKAGIQFCDTDNQWGKCFEQVLPQKEQCDRLDNDCNGKVDDGIDCQCKAGESRACFSGSEGCSLSAEIGFTCKGMCQQGKQFCSDQNTWGACIDAINPQPEVCNGKDDNCDGEIDELYPEWGRTCVLETEQGPCREGRTSCQQGKLTCLQSYQPTEEVCGNGLDDNCDGQIDESPPCKCKPGTSQSCFSGSRGCVLQPDGTFVCKGSCQSGRMNCADDQTWGPCLGQVEPSGKEICDGLDNNCDGQIDEDFPTKGNSCSNGVGECKKVGTLVCASNGLGVSCDAIPGIPSAELCDNKDNDCDGQLDELLTRSCYGGSAGTAGIGECRVGAQSCSAGQWGACIGEIKPTTEICGDGLDNNCDGQNDEGCTCTQGDTQACGLAIGECVQGTQTCNANAWGTCVGEVKPTPEQCDGLDNNCNGQIDENISRTCYSGATGTSGVGLCRVGTQLCNAGQWEPCQGEVTPITEACDGLDNNCDGKVDESWPQLGQICTTGLGSCLQQGLFVCTTDGKAMKCNVNAGVPQPEICDNKDNNCDGQIDENLQQSCYTGPAPTTGAGICKSGIQTCQAGQWGTCNGEVKPAPETCDGKDNNCNGQIDEGCQCQPNQTQACGNNTGECRSGTQICQNGVWSICTGDTPPAAERCDQKDNDCDGQIDEDFPQKGKPCRGGVGACDAPGVFVCQTNGSGVTCNATPGTPTAELCDGIDNDCDGQNDEDFPAKHQACVVGVGECQRSSVNRCTSDKTGLECDASPGAPKNEVCDNKDNDCNGMIDDLLSRACYSGHTSTWGKGECKAGIQTCSAGQWGPCYGEIIPQPEICGDGKDNDCDKKIDEGCGGCSGGETQACGSDIGECRKGTQSCQSGQWGMCNGGVFPAAEVCDDKDNDCDGSVDELWPQKGQACVVGVGACQRNGTLVCRNDRTGLACSVMPGPPSAEICDGIDNNCNGQIDEGCP